MSLVIVLITLLTGTTKSITVCGINSAQVAHQRLAGGRVVLIGYLAGLYLGTAALVLVLAGLGRWLATAAGLGAEPRSVIAGVLLIVIGTAELIHGPWLLPHIPWAVPRTWADRPYLGLPAFGLIRGLAVFNHSPFASMHAWLVIVVLVPDAIPVPILAALLAVGLAIWTLLYAGLAGLRRDRLDLFEAWTKRVLLSTRTLGRVDGLSLAMMGLVTLALAGP